MNHGNSGLAHGTSGSPQLMLENSDATFVASSNESRLALEHIVNTISERAKGLDLREHTSVHRQLSKTKMKALAKKVETRQATKKEYKEYQWNVRFRERRKNGVKRFWRQERERLLRGERGTRNWTKEQRAAIIRGETPKFKGLYVIGHHSYSAVKYPHLADKGEIIYPATSREHFRGWHGGNYKKSSAGKPIVLIIDF